MPRKPRQKLVSVRAYAIHRGCDRKTVRDAIDGGRLEGCVAWVQTKRGAPEPKITDIEAADVAWEANTRPREVAPPRDAVTSREAGAYQTARAAREQETAELQRMKRETAALELGRLRGELVPVADVEQALRSEYHAVKTRLLGLPSRAKQQLPHLAAADVAVIDALVREALEELADGVA